MDKNYDGAIRLLNQALKQEEFSDYKSFIYRIRSMLFLDNKQYPEALSDAQNVTETTPEDLKEVVSRPPLANGFKGVRN
jgi:regulator of sirC expression with transglutaminase-like and TPR domain